MSVVRRVGINCLYGQRLKRRRRHKCFNLANCRVVMYDLTIMHELLPMANAIPTYDLTYDGYYYVYLLCSDNIEILYKYVHINVLKCRHVIN